MDDPARVYDGIRTLEGGMDGGEDASLIAQNQCFLAVNYTFRNSFAVVRPPFSQVVLNFANQSVQNNFTGVFQGAGFYQSAQSGQSGFIVSVGGRLFRITLGIPVTVSEITPNVPINTTSDFTVPGSAGPVSITINSESDVLPTGTTIYIQGGQFLVTGVFGSTLTLNYVSGFVAPTVPIATASAFTPPAVNSNVTILVNNPGSLAPTNDVYIGGTSFHYVIVSITGNSMVVTNKNDTRSNVNAGSNLTNSSGVDFTYSNSVVPSGTPITDVSSNQLFFIATNPSNLQFIHLFQAENYEIILAGQNPTIIYDGSTSRLASIGELPPGVIGTYQWGRCWIALNDRRSFVAGDLVGSSSGTAQNSFVDAVLKVTQNTYIQGGGAFKVPNSEGLICAMGAIAMLDTSLGVGQVMVGTTNSIVGINAPTDRTTWQNLTYPIQTVSALGYGPIAPRALPAVNSDIWFRSLDGARSFQIKRRDFFAWSDTPQSMEMDPIFSADTKNLLFWASAIQFDNKLFCTVSPYLTNNGVIHRGLAVINFDEVSNLKETSSPSWEGVLTGLQIYQIVVGVVDEVSRAFAFVNNNGNIELWEFMTRGTYDQLNTNTTIAYKAIPSIMETKRYPFGDDTQLKRLYTAEIYLDQLTDNVSFVIKWRPDEFPNWSTWVSLNFCATTSQCQLVATAAKVTNAGTFEANGIYMWDSQTNVYTSATGYVIAVQQFTGPTLGWWTLTSPSGELLYTLTVSPNPTWAATPVGQWLGTESGTHPAPLIFLVPDPESPVYVGSCNLWMKNSQQYCARLMITAPPEIVNSLLGGYLHEGYEFQFRIEGTGHFRIRKIKFHAKPITDKSEGEQQTTECQALPVCELPLFGYDVHT